MNAAAGRKRTSRQELKLNEAEHSEASDCYVSAEDDDDQDTCAGGPE